MLLTSTIGAHGGVSIFRTLYTRYMADIQIFNNPQFGEVRVAMTENGEPLFCLADVCKALELTNPTTVKTDLTKTMCNLLIYTP